MSMAIKRVSFIRSSFCSFVIISDSNANGFNIDEILQPMTLILYKWLRTNQKYLIIVRLRLRKYDNTVGTELLEFRQPYYDNDTRKGTAI